MNESSHLPIGADGPVSWKHFVLASRSPRRRELLASLAPGALIDVVPPADPDEPGFAGHATWDSIERQAAAIALGKGGAVRDQCKARPELADAVIIAADTEIVVSDGSGQLAVLGQPPENSEWKSVVADWFRRYYCVGPHWASSAVCVQFPDGRRVVRLARTEVEFHPDVERRLGWYLSTEESRGKAGGYAIQGAASVFVKRVEGSLSNVVGLPLEVLLEILTENPRECSFPGRGGV